MVEPNAKVAEARSAYFVPDEKLAVIVCNHNFDAVWEKKEIYDNKTGEIIESESTFKQKYNNIPSAEDDCKRMRECLEQYGIKNAED